MSTVLGPGGYSRPPYASFAGKVVAKTVGEYTVLGAHGYSRPPHGSFAGKVETTPIPTTTARGGDWPTRKKRRPEYEKRDEQDRRLSESMRAIYEEIVEGKVRVSDEQKTELIEAVRPHVTGRKPRTKLPTPTRVDFAGMREEAAIVRQLIQIRRQQIDDEAAAVLLLMM